MHRLLGTGPAPNQGSDVIELLWGWGGVVISRLHSLQGFEMLYLGTLTCLLWFAVSFRLPPGDIAVE